MDHYIDLRLRPDPDFPPSMLMGALYGRLHRALLDLKAEDIGVSFPDHKTGMRARTPGDRLRLHGEKSRLEQLMALPWLASLRELLECSDVTPVPSDASHRVVRRRQFKTGSPSQARRYARRNSVSEAEAEELMRAQAQRRIELPFVQVGSRSTGERFALFFEHGPAQAAPTPGHFNHYGLSREATVPWF